MHIMIGGIEMADKEEKLCAHCERPLSECKGHPGLDAYIDTFYTDGSYQGD